MLRNSNFSFVMEGENGKTISKSGYLLCFTFNHIEYVIKEGSLGIPYIDNFPDDGFILPNKKAVKCLVEKFEKEGRFGEEYPIDSWEPDDETGLEKDLRVVLKKEDLYAKPVFTVWEISNDSFSMSELGDEL